ncbi:MAG: hypothetical protein M1275_01100 [Patescibacteria group bacterium]|nr:hypothetical protein [Patescibacteria group bacterium]
MANLRFFQFGIEHYIITRWKPASLSGAAKGGFMQGIERAYCDVCVRAVIGAWRELMDATGVETLRRVRYGKGDTLGLDAITEITIKERLEHFDRHAIFITEEQDDQVRRRWPTDSDPVKQPLMFFCDPTDRSNQLKKFFELLSKDNPLEKIGRLMVASDSGKLWEDTFEAPVAITGPTSAITCVRKGEVIFSVILNFVTATIFAVTDAGIFQYRLSDFASQEYERLTLSGIIKNGARLHFPTTKELDYSPDDCRKFVTFLGKEGYRENFNDSMLFTESADVFLHHSQPPGPPRVMYLSQLQQGHGAIGFIMANGEKIGEWMHWLPFVKYARTDDGNPALRAFEISLERPWIKNGMLMSTSKPYSLFNGGNPSYLDISQLRNFERPSQFRCMMVVAPSDNERILHVLEQHQYREVTTCF